MSNPSQFKKIHIAALIAGAVIVGAFFWSTISTFAFNGPASGPPSSNGAISSDASNNLYVGGNLNVTGTITSANNFNGGVTAANISSGQFGAISGGNFYFPAAVGVGTTSAAFPLTVNGTTSAAAYCISGANCITAWPGGASGANPTASVGTSAVNGSASTFMRSDAAPAINQAATFSFSALGNTTSTGNISASTFLASTSITNVGVKSALVLNSGAGLEGAYGGASACANNGLVSAISATGATTCVNSSTILTNLGASTATGANPSGNIGTSAVNGSASTFMRSDGAPAINQAATFAFSALGNTTSTGNISAKTFTAAGVSSTIKLGTSVNVSHGCIELYDAVNSSTVDYLYVSGTALVVTSTKPTFCM